MERRRGQDARRERLLEVYERYQRVGTLAGVGRELGLTRERVRQLLRAGEHLGLYSYPASQRRVRLTRKDLMEAYRQEGSLRGVARRYRISVSAVYRVSQAQGFDAATRRRLWWERTLAMDRARYEQIRTSLGREPTALELQANRQWRIVYDALRRHGGGWSHVGGRGGSPRRRGDGRGTQGRTGGRRVAGLVNAEQPWGSEHVGS